MLRILEKMYAVRVEMINISLLKRRKKMEGRKSTHRKESCIRIIFQNFIDSIRMRKKIYYLTFA